MDTYQLKNPYFDKGWEDWAMHNTGSTDATAIDGVKYGIMSGYPLDNGFPTVGNSYVLIAASITTDVESDYFAMELHSGGYSFADGDIIVFDLSYRVLTADADFIAQSGNFRIGVGYGETPAMYLSFKSDIQTAGLYTKTIAYVASTSDTGVRIFVRYDAPGTAAVADIRNVVIDNIRVFPACSNYSATEANDATGVT